MRVCQEECVQVFTYTCLWMRVHCCWPPRTLESLSQEPQTRPLLLVLGCPPVHGGSVLGAAVYSGHHPEGLLEKV